MNSCRKSGCNCPNYIAKIMTVNGSVRDYNYWYGDLNIIPECNCGHEKNMHGKYIDPIEAKFNAFLTGTKDENEYQKNLPTKN